MLRGWKGAACCAFGLASLVGCGHVAQGGSVQGVDPIQAPSFRKASVVPIQLPLGEYFQGFVGSAGATKGMGASTLPATLASSPQASPQVPTEPCFVTATVPLPEAGTGAVYTLRDAKGIPILVVKNP